MRILNVAEKNSVAKEIAAHLSGNSFHRRTGSAFIADFGYTIAGQPCEMIVTAVRGHLMELDFDDSCKSWTGVDPSSLFTAPIRQSIAHNDVAASIRSLAREAQQLVLWLDCDREGEAIAFEVLQVCLQSNQNLEVFRAHFSALTFADLTRAAQNLGQPNRYLSEAVLARSEIDLRVGAAFTRYLTLRYQTRLSGGGEKRLVSFGGCQTVTLGFVVAKWLARERFVPEQLWSLKLKCAVTSSGEVNFLWNRHRIFDSLTVNALRHFCANETHATVTEAAQQPKSKWRPLPLNTLELTKVAASQLRIPSHRCMKLAESLYAKGYISYPRTDTDMFHETMDLRQLVSFQTNNSEWGGYARDLLEGRLTRPRNGSRDDKAHPPIHPLKSVERSEFSDIAEEYKVYELVARHFLACVSPDAKGSNSHIEVKVGETERFHVDGLVVLERNWLEIYPYTKWTSSSQTIPNCRVGDRLPVLALEIGSGTTEAPEAMTEPEILSLMDKEGIGTDATMHEHIRTIQERGYCHMDNNGYFIPSPLGIALIIGLGAYESYAGFHLAKPTLRAAMERDMELISRGQMTRPEFIRRYSMRMKEIFTAISDNPFPLDSEINCIAGGGGGPPPPPGGGGFATVRSTHLYPQTTASRQRTSSTRRRAPRAASTTRQRTASRAPRQPRRRRINNS